MKLTYDPHLYELEDGIALAVFLSVVVYTPDAVTNPRAASYGPSLRWEFAVVSKENFGKHASCLTSMTPTPRNSCMRMMSGLAGRPVKENEVIDTDQYIGRFYRIVIHEGRVSTQHTPMYMGTTEEQATRAYECLTPPSGPALTPDNTAPF